MRVVKKNEKRIRKEDGLSMLEYAAGAAVLAGAVYGAMTYFGEGLQTFFQALGDWASSRASDLGTTVTGGGSSAPTP